MATANLKIGTRVRIETINLAKGECASDWSTTGRVVPNHHSWKRPGISLPDGYYTISFDPVDTDPKDGRKTDRRMMIHISSLQVANDQKKTRKRKH